MSEPDFIHRYIPSSTGSARVLLLLHGTGGDESDMLPIGRELDPDAAILSPRGKVLENGAPRFFRRFAEGVFDEEDVMRRAHELADFLAAAAAKYAFALDRVTAVGYSNGANIAAAMMLLRTEAIREAVLFRAMVTLSNPPQSDLSGRAVLISAGRRDPIIPLENAQRLTSALQQAGATVQLEVQEASHALVQGDLVVAKRFLGR
ncbi:MAG TPA: alpha/beta hydrolase [Chthoniobacterales bacterium]|jgi:phospholipase/carboxylesterase